MSSPTAEFAGPPPGLAAEDIERRRRLLLHWRRRSALVKLLRRVLPALCILILAALAGWAGVSALRLRQDAETAKAGLQIRMLHPIFQGRAESGRPFVVRAAAAVRDNADSAQVTLESPVLEFGGPQDWMTVKARRGVYREDTRMLDLQGGVVLDDVKGNHLATEHALVDTVRNEVTGETPIEGRGPLGRIAASAYAVRQGGAYIHFAGRVKSRIESGSGLVSAPPAK